MHDVSVMVGTLRAVLPQGELITGIAPLTTGFSNETYLIEGPDLILRLPPSAGAMLDGHNVVMQAKVYEELGRTAGAPPVPAIVTIGEDPSLIGVPFFVMERVAGESVNDLEMQTWFTDASEGFREQLCRDWISAIAKHATLAPLSVLGAPLSPEADLLRWRNFAEAANNASLLPSFDRLLASPAPLSGPPAVIHGDTKLSNMMWHNGSLSSVLDWEMSLNGEPLADLGYVLYAFESPYHGPTRAQKLPGMFSRDEVIRLWQEVSGRSAEGLFWHEVAQIAKTCAIIAEGVNIFVTGRSSDPKLAAMHTNLDYYRGVLDAMLDGGGY
jgi:aminoglycoside phosphotransferase (APT) family kinase protein